MAIILRRVLGTGFQLKSWYGNAFRKNCPTMWINHRLLVVSHDEGKLIRSCDVFVVVSLNKLLEQSELPVTDFRRHAAHVSTLWYQSHQQVLYSLSGKTSYRQISWSLEAARLGVISHHPEIWQAPRQRCCRGACQISERLEKSKHESRDLETSRDLAVRRLTA